MGTPEVPLEHAHETIEHHAHGTSERWVMGVALTAAILAALAAVTALCAEYVADEAMLERIDANDKWNESQSDSIKEKLLDTKKVVLSSMNKELDPEEAKKLGEYPGKKEENRADAKRQLERSAAHVHKHLPLSVSLTMFQVGIAVGAISVLTKRREFWFVALAFGAVGVVFLVWGFIV